MSNQCKTTRVDHGIIVESTINDSVLNRPTIIGGTAHNLQISSSALVSCTASSVLNIDSTFSGAMTINASMTFNELAATSLVAGVSSALNPVIDARLFDYTETKFVHKVNGSLLNPSIQGGITLDAATINSLVSYLKASLIGLMNTDAPVRSVNGETGLVTLTAQHVGAVNFANPLLVGPSIQGSVTLDEISARSFGVQIVPEVVDKIKEIIASYLCGADGDCQQTLRDCNGVLLPENTEVVTCAVFDEVISTYQKTLRDCTGTDLPENTEVVTCTIFDEVISTYQKKLLNCSGVELAENTRIATCNDLGTFQPALQDCDGNNLPAGTKVVTCEELNNRAKISVSGTIPNANITLPQGALAIVFAANQLNHTFGGAYSTTTGAFACSHSGLLLVTAKGQFTNTFSTGIYKIFFSRNGFIAARDEDINPSGTQSRLLRINTVIDVSEGDIIHFEAQNSDDATATISGVLEMSITYISIG